MKDFITIHKEIVHNREAVEVELSGSMNTLASMVYSSMKNDERFAQIVMTAVAHYQNLKMMEDMNNRQN
jgi:hypothetical protein